MLFQRFIGFVVNEVQIIFLGSYCDTGFVINSTVFHLSYYRVISTTFRVE